MGELIKIDQVISKSLPEPQEVCSLGTSTNNFLTAKEAKELGYGFLKPEPEPLTCEFCGKELPYRGMKHFIQNSIWLWFSPEPCSCEKAQNKHKEINEQRERERQQEEEQERRLKLQRKVSRLFEQSKLGERFKTRTFENYRTTEKNGQAYKTAKKYSDNFEQYKKEGIGLIFSGTYGTGKTHLAAAIAIDLINRGIPVIFGTAINLLSKVRQSYSSYDNENEEDILQLYKTVDLLVIDDLGKEKPSEWVLEKLYSILNERYENFKPVIITTNYGTESLINRLTLPGNAETAEAIISRLHEMCRGVLLEGEDYRKAL